MAAADVAMWLADRGDELSKSFSCTATILKVGRRLIYGTAECVSPSGRLLAHSTITYIRE